MSNRFDDDREEVCGDKRLVEIACEVLVETKQAFKVCDGVTTCWLPKSQVEHYPETNPRKRSSVMVMPEWLAQEKGLI